MVEVDDTVSHYGVKGMHWGIRKASSGSSGPTPVTLKTKPGKKLKAQGGKGHEATDDAMKAAVSRQKAKKSGTQALSNAEMEALVKRMNLEQQYKKLSAGQKSAGQKFIEKELLSLGKQEIPGLLKTGVNEIKVRRGTKMTDVMAEQVRNQFKLAMGKK
jgi:hypothetical protein